MRMKGQEILCVMMRVTLFLVLSIIALPLFAQTTNENRMALIIGNSAYKSSPLLNPVNDAVAIGQTLESLGFEVTIKTNLNWQEMNAVIAEFGERLEKSSGVGLFYYAGHGIQVEGKNYLIPINTSIQHEKEIKYKAIDASLVLSEMENARNRMNIIILDACRGNPFARSFRTTSSGLVYMDHPQGTIIAYATGPGKKADDGEDENGLYTSELIRQMKVPGLRLEDIFARVRRAVRIQTNGQQIPWESTSLEGIFYFILPETKSEAPTPLPPKGGTEGGVFQNAVHIEQLETTWKDPVTGIEFVRIAGGCYQMGCSDKTKDCEEDEYPPHEVCLDDFWMAINEVTNAQFVKFLNEFGQKSHDGESWLASKSENSHSNILEDGGRFRVEQGYDQHPVITVSWYGAMAFAKWLSKKNGKIFDLPTEAQWEYAARSGGKIQEYSGGSDSYKFAWTTPHSHDVLHPVGMKDKNELGLYDMSGNVWEWCRDIYKENTYHTHATKNPVEIVVDINSGGNSARVIRGGSYRYDARRSRCTNRGSHQISSQSNDLGFRLVMENQSLNRTYILSRCIAP